MGARLTRTTESVKGHRFQGHFLFKKTFNIRAATVCEERSNHMWRISHISTFGIRQSLNLFRLLQNAVAVK